ncbi:MAG TPA: hypothetical protein VFG20_06170 [Planctomycetaceae bacterium]|jgi:hypothetical protein|nr:hypothetical protein [Planctomycetaceae bacterium]
MVMVIDPTGTVTTLYSELFDLAALGTQNIARASHVEPDAEGNWSARILNGPTLGPFARRSDALAAEVAWLTEHRLSRVG